MKNLLFIFLLSLSCCQKQEIRIEYNIVPVYEYIYWHGTITATAEPVKILAPEDTHASYQARMFFDERKSENTDRRKLKRVYLYNPDNLHIYTYPSI